MLVVEIDRVDLQPPQTRVAAFPHIRRVATDAEEFAVRAPHVAELGGEHDPLAMAGEGLRNQLLVATDALAGLEWSYDEAKALHQDLSRAMKLEQEWLAENRTGLMRAA